MKLPTEWELKRIEEIADVKGGKRLPKGYSLVKENTGFPYIRVTDMKNGTVDESGILYIPVEVAPKISRYIINKSDVFISVAGNGLGITGIIPESLDGANLTENADKLTNLKINQKFLFEVLRSPIIQNKVEAEKTQNAQPKLALTRIKGFEIPVPPLPEQKKIAQILSTWDKAITTTEQLLANSQQQKKALMQQLLTGKKRLLDKSGDRFSGEWKTTEIGDFLQESRIPSKNNDPSKRLTVRLNLKGIEPREFRGTEAVESTAHFVRSAGQFIYGKQNIHKGAFGIIPKNLDAYETSQDLPAFDFTGACDSIWFYHYMTQENFFASLEDKMSGTGSKRLNPKTFFKIKLVCPPIEEQQKIAAVLSAADQEITSLQHKLDALKQEKKALMQQLLTGKRRVKIEEAA